MRNLSKATLILTLGIAGIAAAATVQHSSTDSKPKPKASQSTTNHAAASTDRANALKARHDGGAAADTARASAAHAVEPSSAQHGSSKSTEATSTPTKHASAGVDSEKIWNELVEGNERFVAGRPSEKNLVASRQKLVAGQHPDAIVLACADSRVSPELIFDQGLGELFVVRVAGNVADPAALGSIEYAIEHLHCGVLIVIGHDKCGAVAAAASGATMPTENLNAIVRRIDPSIENLRLCAEGDQLVHMGVRMNAHGSACAMLQESQIVSHAVASGELDVITAVYELESGVVRRLPTTPCVQAQAR